MKAQNISATEKASKLIDYSRVSALKLPEQIVFGSGKLGELGALIDPFLVRGRVMIVVGGKSAERSGLLGRVVGLLGKGVENVLFSGVANEPTSQMVDEAAVLARRSSLDLVIGLGGGSVIDCAKAVAALATNIGSVEDYLEGVGRGFALKERPLPLIAIPTTAGTGAEVTKNAVICSHEKGYKRSMRDDRMLARLALIDPELSRGVPRSVRAAGGLDAITQLIEPCLTVKRQPATTVLAHQALRGTPEALLAGYRNSDDLAAREQLALGAMVSGVCLANAGLAMVHGIAAALGAIYDIAHGLACGILLPHALDYLQRACKSDLAAALAAYLDQKEIGPETIQTGIKAIRELSRAMEVPPDLKFLKVGDDGLSKLAELSMGSSMSGNPVPMTPQKVSDFLRPLL